MKYKELTKDLLGTKFIGFQKKDDPIIFENIDQGNIMKYDPDFYFKGDDKVYRVYTYYKDGTVKYNINIVEIEKQPYITFKNNVKTNLRIQAILDKGRQILLENMVTGEGWLCTVEKYGGKFYIWYSGDGTISNLRVFEVPKHAIEYRKERGDIFWEELVPPIHIKDYEKYVLRRTGNDI